MHISQKHIDEIKKVKRRLPLWAEHQHQYNARILNAFLALKNRGQGDITENDIKRQYGHAGGDETNFYGNFSQMLNFGEQNHGKVFSKKGWGGTVEIWEPIAEEVTKYEKAVKIAIAHGRTTTNKITDAEWQVRTDLATCYRLFVKFGWTDLIFTHLSARVPGNDEHYLINPYGLLFEEVTASNLIKVDFAGNVITGDSPFNDAGHAIHSAVLKARPDVNAVLHSHTRAGMAVSCMQCGLLPLTQQANEVRELVCHHDYGVADTNTAAGENECRKLGEDISNADKWLMIMHNHGLLSVGRTVAEAFYFLYTLENACKVQVDVMSSGAKTITPDDESLKLMHEYSAPPPDAPSDFVTRSWSALMRMLEREDSSHAR